LIKHQISAEEKTIEIYYCFALEKPKLSKTIEEDDWVWEISKFSGPLSNSFHGLFSLITIIDESDYYGVAHFDGSVAIYNEKGQRISKYQVAEDSSIRAVRIIPSVAPGDENCYYVITGSNDETIRIDSLRLGKNIRFEPRLLGKG